LSVLSGFWGGVLITLCFKGRGSTARGPPKKKQEQNKLTTQKENRKVKMEPANLGS